MIIVGDSRGIALFLVLWILTLLSVIVGEFCYAMRTELNIARNFREETEAYYVAKGGMNVVIYDLSRQGVRDSVQADSGIPDMRWRINADNPSVELGNGRFTAAVGNESGKININTADAQMLRMILSGLGVEESERDMIVDSIQDWRDEDDLHRINGAETDYYASLSPPYAAKNGPFDTIEELMRVRGVTADIYWGGLNRMVTVYGEKKGRGGLKINLNAASPQMLAALPGLDADSVQAITDYRKSQDFKSVSQLMPLVGEENYSLASRFLSLDLSSIYTLQITGAPADSPTRSQIEAVVEIDRRFSNGFRMLQWLDAPVEPIRTGAGGAV